MLAACGLDRLVGDPRWCPHPVVLMAWLAELERLGHQPRSGYWADRVGRSGDGAGGMLLFWAAHWAAAEALVQTDPLIEQGCVSWCLHEWAVVFPPGAPRQPL